MVTVIFTRKADILPQQIVAFAVHSHFEISYTKRQLISLKISGCRLRLQYSMTLLNERKCSLQYIFSGAIIRDCSRGKKEKKRKGKKEDGQRQNKLLPIKVNAIKITFLVPDVIV